MTMRRSIALLSLALQGCNTLPENYAQFSSDYDFLHSVAKFNAPIAFPPKIGSGEISEEISYVTAAYEDLGGYTRGGYGGVLPQSRLEVAIDKYCLDKGGSRESPLSINERIIYACKNGNKTTVTIHFPGKEHAGFDTGEDYSYKYFVAMYTFSTKWSKIISESIASNYLAFEGRNISDKLLNNVDLQKSTLSSFVQKILVTQKTSIKSTTEAL